MSILKFSGKANPAASAENVRYITRDRACADISFYNLDELKADSQAEARSNAIAYAETRKDIEARQPPPPRGIARNHHRMVLSFDREETPERASEQAHQFLKENFPDARAIVSVHTDKKDQTHAHVWIDCRTREIDKRGIEKKLQIDKATYKTLDERFAQQYDRTYGTRYADDYRQKKEETRQWKRDRVEGKDTPKPERARDGMTADKYREKDLRDAGVKSHELDQNRPSGNKRFDTDGQRPIDDSERATTDAGREIDSSIKTNERAEFGAGETVRAAEKLHSEFERLGERSHSLDHDRDAGRER